VSHYETAFLNLSISRLHNVVVLGFQMSLRTTAQSYPECYKQPGDSLSSVKLQYSMLVAEY